MPHLYSNHMSRVVHDAAVRYHAGFTGKINAVEANRIYANTDACDQMYWESESQTPQDVMPVEEIGLKKI